MTNTHVTDNGNKKVLINIKGIQRSRQNMNINQHMIIKTKIENFKM